MSFQACSKGKEITLLKNMKRLVFGLSVNCRHLKASLVLVCHVSHTLCCLNFTEIE